MPNEAAAARGRDRLACALIAFLIVCLVGGAAALVMMAGFKSRVEETARRDARLIGETVARSLAMQFEKAARAGIPLKLLPGVEPYLAETLVRTPGLTRIVLRGPDGREIRSAIGAVTGMDTVSASISIDGISFGQIDVTTSPVALSSILAQLSWRATIAVLACATLAALGAAFYAGGSLAVGRRRLASLLRASAEGRPQDLPQDIATAGGARGPLAAAFRALASGERHLAERRANFEGYAEELLAVDFDGRLRADIERVRRDVRARPDLPRVP